MRLAVLSTLVLFGTLTAQDEKQDSGVLEIKIKVGKRPTSGTGIPGINFELKPAVNVEGKAASVPALRASMEKAIQYVLNEQDKDGFWTLKDSQLSDIGRRSGFRNTARDAVSRVVLTALACMALRAHEELAPGRIKPAVERGLEYVIENAPRHTKERYGVWTWSFCIEFLVDEYKRATDAGLKSRIKESVQKTADRLLQNQHKGIRAAKPFERPDPERAVPSYKDEAAKRQEAGRRQNTGGYLGITPGQDGGDDDEGLMVDAVAPNGPAQKAGLRQGDRILEVNGQKVKSADELIQMARNFKPDQEITLKVERESKKGEQYPVDQDRPRRQQQPARIPEDGGWSYYQMGAMSFPTATAVIALLDAKEIGCEIPKEAIDRGVSLLEASRIHTKGSEDGYGYRAGHGGDLRASIGRVCVIEMALLQCKKSDLKYMERAIQVFTKMRQELDLVLGYPGNHVRFSFANAAYYFLYAHYYSARSLHALKDDEKKAKYGAVIQEALLRHQMKDGTWHDHESWGRLYGTSMALMAFGHLKHVTPDAYKEVIKSVDVEEY